MSKVSPVLPRQEDLPTILPKVSPLLAWLDALSTILPKVSPVLPTMEALLTRWLRLFNENRLLFHYFSLFLNILIMIVMQADLLRCCVL